MGSITGKIGSIFNHRAAARVESNPLDMEYVDSLSVEYVPAGSDVPVCYHQGGSYVMIMVNSGTASLDSMTTNLESRFLYFMRPSNPFKLSIVSADFSCYIISFKQRFLADALMYEPLVDNLAKLTMDETIRFRLAEDSYQVFLRTFERLYEEFQSNKLFRSGMLKTLFVELLLQIGRATESPGMGLAVGTSRKQGIVSEFIRLVNKYFLTKRTVAEYASMMLVSAKHLSETVKEVTGVTALHIIHYRIYQEAKYWLLGSTLTMKEIAAKLNFENSSDFGRFFKRIAGTTPTRFQQLAIASV